MFLGMGVLGGAAAVGLSAAGGSATGLPGTLRVALMGLYMTIPMVAWMRYRGHSAARSAEMAASMIAPTVAAAALVAAGLVATGMGLALQHTVMVPAMLAVMIWRYDEYAGSRSPSR